jgi:type VI secretion system protein ImpJ
MQATKVGSPTASRSWQMSSEAAGLIPADTWNGSGYGWGIAHLAVDAKALANGTFTVTSVAGMLRDGLPFAYAAGDFGEMTLELPVDSESVTVFIGRGSDAVDGNGPQDFPICLCVDVVDEGASLPIARVSRRRTDGALILDNRFVPPSLVVRNQPLLSGPLDELTQLVRQRAMQLAPRLATSREGVIIDFLFLQVLNTTEIELRHLQNLPQLHPERLFLVLARLAANLRTFNAGDRLALNLPVYCHIDPAKCFEPLFGALRSELTMSLSPTARQVPIEERRYGVRVALFGESSFDARTRVLMEVRSALAPEELRTRFPSQVKIGPIEALRDLVNLQIPGIALRPLAVAPREVPYVAGATYFEIDSRPGELWDKVRASKGLAMHVAGDFPELEMTLWIANGDA